MQQKSKDYAITSLAMSGVAVMNSGMAYTLRPDPWSHLMECGVSAATPERDPFLLGLGARLIEIQFAGSSDWTLVAIRSLDEIERRIEWVTGRQVVGFRPYEPPQPMPAAPTRVEVKDEPPAHQCADRDRWFEERGMVDPHKPSENRRAVSHSTY
jgi:hypothetical protein